MKWRTLNKADTDVVIAVLREIERCLEICYWNKNQKEMISPFGNTAEKYSCDAFKVHAYDWSERNENNFVYKDQYYPQSNMKVTWYKYLGRDDYVRVPEKWDMQCLSDMLEQCKNSIRKDFGEETYESS